jgi:hypothetical protein
LLFDLLLVLLDVLDAIASSRETVRGFTVGPSKSGALAVFLFTSHNGSGGREFDRSRS